DNPKKQDLISELVKEEDGIMAAEKTLSKINMDEWRWIIQGQIEGRKRDYTSGLLAAERRGIAKGHASGLAEGAQRNAIANARTALNMGLTPEQVSQITALSLEQVLALKNELKVEN
ncbi:MAG: hypothetical protein IKO39_02755, partial [Treponema sp.]|nr:hypothetical protein [Treponema sp.]